MRSKKIWHSTVVSIFAVIMAMMLGGCTERTEADEVEYTVISDGTTASETVNEAIYADVSDKELYIPKYMVTKYASLDYDFRMQDAYDDVVDTIRNFRDKTYIPLTISTEDYIKVLETVRCEQLMLFYVEDRHSGDFNSAAQTYEMNFYYGYDIKEVNQMLMDAEQAAKEILLLIDPEMSDYEKVKVFHDYLVLNVESTTETENGDNIYGCLVEKKALCEGYAKTFSYLCNMVGIENMIATGSTGVDHMWNMVKIEGEWYHIDVAWDKPPDALKEQFPDMILYQHFLADDSIMKNSRVIYEMFFTPPEAHSEKCNYFIKENKYAYNYKEALEIIERSCATCIDSGEKYFMLKLDSSNLYLYTTAQLIKPDENGASDIDKIVDKLNFMGKISYIDYFSSYRVIIFVLE